MEVGRNGGFDKIIGINLELEPEMGDVLVVNGHDRAMSYGSSPKSDEI
jgi:hypothetical protein